MNHTESRGCLLETGCCLLVVDDLLTTTDLSAAAAADATLEIVVVSSVAAALQRVRERRFDVVAVQADIGEGDSLDLLRPPARQRGTDYLVLARTLTKQQAIDAVRLGAKNVFEAPIDAGVLFKAICRTVRRRVQRRRDRQRYIRLRDLSSRIIKDRREVRRRVDIVCRDLVGAYRSLAEKVVAMDVKAPESGESA